MIEIARFAAEHAATLDLRHYPPNAVEGAIGEAILGAEALLKVAARLRRCFDPQHVDDDARPAA